MRMRSLPAAEIRNKPGYKNGEVLQFFSQFGDEFYSFFHKSVTNNETNMEMLSSAIASANADIAMHSRDFRGPKRGRRFQFGHIFRCQGP